MSPQPLSQSLINRKTPTFALAGDEIPMSLRCLSIVVSFFFCLGVQSAVAQLEFGGAISAISIEGNQRYSDIAIKDQLDLETGDPFSPGRLNEALKALLSGGLVTEAEFKRSGDTLVVQVVEPQFVNRIFFEGNSEFKDEELIAFIGLSVADPLSQLQLQRDVRALLDAYGSRSLYNAEVRPFVNDTGEGRVDVTFDINEGFASRVGSVSFVGNDAFSDRTLRGVVSTKQNSIWRRVTQGAMFTEQALNDDKNLLAEFYNDRGYADFEVTAAQGALSPDQSGFVVTFAVSEGPRYRLGDISIISDLAGLNAQYLDPFHSLQRGAIFNGSRLAKGQERILETAESLGFGAAEIKVDLNRDPESQIVDVIFRVVPGPSAQVERIEIQGNLKTHDYVIRREMRLAEGDAFSRNRLQRSMQRIRALGYFSQSEMFLRPGTGPGQAIVTVEVEEAPTGSLTFGGGVSSGGGPTLSFAYSESNFLGRGQRVGASVDLGSDSRSYSISFNEPWMFGREISGGFEIFDETAQVQGSGYSIKDQGGGLSSGYKLSEYWSQNWSLASKNSMISEVTSSTLAIQDQETNTTRNTVESTLSFNNLDSPFDPTSGVLFNLSGRAAGFSGDANWNSLTYDFNYFQPLGENLVLKLSSSAGRITAPSGGTVPFIDRYTIGGDLVRGFARGGIGPRASSTEDAIGSLSYYGGSAELQFPIPGMANTGLGARVFYDAGSAFDQGSNYNLVSKSGTTAISDSDKLRTSAGVGITWVSPIGPLNFDWGFAQSSESFDKQQQSSFSFGVGF